MKPWILSTAIAALSAASFANSEQTLTVESKPHKNWFALEAQMEAVNEATISAQTSGRIQKIFFDVNDYVEQGALLIQLRDKQQRASFEQAEAGLAQANANNVDAQSKLEQSRPLFKQGSLSKGQMDTIEANAKSAQAAVIAAKALLKQAKEQLSYTQIRAPYSGIVKARLVEVGESVNPGTPVMTGLSLAKLRATADIPQRFAPHLSDQKSFNVSYDGKSFAAEKVTVFPYADPNSHSFKVRVEINAEGSQLFPGMWVKLNVPMGERTTIQVPSSAIIQKGELSGVYVKLGDQYQLRQVRLGQTEGEHVEVLSGLRNGENIVEDAYAHLAKVSNAPKSEEQH